MALQCDFLAQIYHLTPLLHQFYTKWVCKGTGFIALIRGKICPYCKLWLNEKKQLADMQSESNTSVHAVSINSEGVSAPSFFYFYLFLFCLFGKLFLRRILYYENLRLAPHLLWCGIQRLFSAFLLYIFKGTLKNSSSEATSQKF